MMKNKQYTLLQNIDDDVIAAFIEDGHTEDEAMCLYEYEGHPVEVLSEETDYYWNIKLLNGLKFNGISGYHLKGYEDKLGI